MVMHLPPSQVMAVAGKIPQKTVTGIRKGINTQTGTGIHEGMTNPLPVVMTQVATKRIAGIGAELVRRQIAIERTLPSTPTTDPLEMRTRSDRTTKRDGTGVRAGRRAAAPGSTRTRGTTGGRQRVTAGGETIITSGLRTRTGETGDRKRVEIKAKGLFLFQFKSLFYLICDKRNAIGVSSVYGVIVQCHTTCISEGLSNRKPYYPAVQSACVVWLCIHYEDEKRSKLD